MQGRQIWSICLVLVFYFVLTIKSTDAADANGQKAHFQVHDKEQGKLEIHATKDSAKITATADSVQMVVDPGTEEAPPGLLPPKVIILNTPAASDAIKRNRISEHNKIGKKATKKYFLSHLHKKWKTKHYKKHDINASKKSLVDKEMRIHGQSGGLHIHTDHNYTALNSESGKLEIYIKNPEYHTEPSVAEHHSDIDVYVKTEADKKDRFHERTKISTVHITQDVNGLKKSVVHSKKLDNIRSKHRPCAIPPCSL